MAERAQSRDGKLGIVEGQADKAPESNQDVATTARFGEEPASSKSEKSARTSNNGPSNGGASPRKRSSLTERLQQRREADSDAEATRRFDETEGEADPKPSKRRPAGPPPRRLSTPANDDLPSIGGLIFALQQKPSRLPFAVAGGVSVVWLIVASLFSYGAFFGAGTSGPSALTATATILVPIAVFWFLALLVWRAQELRLMASAMTEVAVRLAEPDTLAEQSVTSLGQVIRRQVAAMNDGISRAIGRASELEALVHNEVAALERSYGENETRVRGLISELASEREALSNTSTRVGESIKGVSQRVSQDILAATSEIDKSLADRGLKLTELLVARSNEAAAEVYKAQDVVASQMPRLMQQLGSEQVGLTRLVENAVQNLQALESSVGQRTQALDQTLRERGEAFDRAMAERGEALDRSLHEHGEMLDQTFLARSEALSQNLQQRNEAIDKTLHAHGNALTQNLSQYGQALDQNLRQHGQTLDQSLREHGQTLDQSLRERGEALDRTLVERSEAMHLALRDRSEALHQSLSTRIKTLEGLVGQSTTMIDRTLEERTKALGVVIDHGAQTLVKSLEDGAEVFAVAADESASGLETALRSRTDAFTAAINQGAVALDKTMAERTSAFSASIGEQGRTLEASILDHMNRLDNALTTRAGAVIQSLANRRKALETSIIEHTTLLDKTLAERSEGVKADLEARLKAIDTTFQQRSAEVDRVLTSHIRSAEDTFGKQTANLHKVLVENSATLRDTAEVVADQSDKAVQMLSRQTETLKQVSTSLLDQIHSLTQRFENQGQGILTAAQALETSNTKIDSILESRHQAIIGLLHTVTNKAQDLDQRMQNYVGIITKTMTEAEARAKHATELLAQDSSTQARQAVAQIEKLRTEAQAHTARAVEDLKTSFTRVITQIGQQMEQMRGQFDSTSQGMREAARQTASDLDALRREMQTRLDALPQHTAQATAAIRKALADQMSEIEAITPLLTQAATQNARIAADPAYRAAASSPAEEPATLKSETLLPPAQTYDYPPLPQYDVYSQAGADAGGDDMGMVVGNLAQQLSGASSSGAGTSANGGGAVSNAYPTGANAGRDVWAGDPRGTNRLQETIDLAGRGHAPSPQASRSNVLRLEELARAIDPHKAAEAWQRYRAGQQGVFGRYLYTRSGQATFDEVSRRYRQDRDFRATVDRYMADFERLLGEAEQADPDGRMLDNYLVSETGLVYLLLAHASGRLR